MQTQLKNFETKSTQSPSSALSPAAKEGDAATNAAESEFHAPSRLRFATARPVFVVGCPRSGTTLLYHMIQSSGDFALVPWESHAFDFLGRWFPNLTSRERRKRLMQVFLRTRRFLATGLYRDAIEPRVLNQCRNIGDFLRIVMEEMCRKQGVRRWAEKTPHHVLYIREIKRSFPDALVVHIIRDGRDVALSLANMHHWRPDRAPDGRDAALSATDMNPVRVYAWQCGGRLLAMGVYWRWMVRKGRAAGREIGSDYYELHYEDLVKSPRETLTKLGDFIGHDLDYDRILGAGVGTVCRPDTSFPSQSFNPIERWKKLYSPHELSQFEAAVGDCLEEFGYNVATEERQRPSSLAARTCRAVGVTQMSLKHWFKLNTPLSRLAGSKAA